jgi:hypothetical protein
MGVRSSLDRIQAHRYTDARMPFVQAVFNAVRRATLRICRVRPVIAMAPTAYVTDGPKVQ